MSASGVGVPSRRFHDCSGNEITKNSIERRDRGKVAKVKVIVQVNCNWTASERTHQTSWCGSLCFRITFMDGWCRRWTCFLPEKKYSVDWDTYASFVIVRVLGACSWPQILNPCTSIYTYSPCLLGTSTKCHLRCSVHTRINHVRSGYTNKKIEMYHYGSCTIILPVVWMSRR